MSPRQRVIHYCLTLKDCFVDIGIKNSAISATCCEEGNACGVQIHHISVTRLPRSYVSVKKWRGVELLRVNVHMCTETEMQNKWIKNKSEWGRGIKTICLGQCHVAIGASKRRQSGFFFGGGGVCKPVRWLKVSIGQSSDKDLKEQRCMGEDGGFAICGHGDVEIKVLHPQLCL